MTLRTRIVRFLSLLLSLLNQFALETLFPHPPAEQWIIPRPRTLMGIR